jgi:hypothetical protein
LIAAYIFAGSARPLDARVVIDSSVLVAALVDSGPHGTWAEEVPANHIGTKLRCMSPNGD